MTLDRCKNYLIASSILAGTILGVGMFGLPYVFAKAGFLTALLFLFICFFLVLTNHLLYGEALLRTPGEHRFPGLARIYLGKWGVLLASLSVIISDAGILLAYLILGGQFMQNLIQAIGLPIGNGMSTVIFWLLGILGVTFGIGFIGISEMLSIILIIVFIVGFFILGAPHLQLASLMNFKVSQLFFPYGILLFALSDGSAVPEIFGYFKKKKISKQNIDLKKPIIWGTILPPILYLMFVLGAFGLLGQGAESINIIPALMKIHPALGIASNILGLILILSSYFIISLSYRKTLHIDIRCNKHISWLIPVLIPLLLFFLGIQNFIGIINFIGAVTLGIIITMTVLIHRRSQKQGQINPPYQIKMSSPVRLILIILLLTGVIIEIAKFF